MIYIQALGNAASTEAREKLLENLENRENDQRIRVHCVWALRRILQAARDKVSYLGPCVREYIETLIIRALDIKNLIIV